MKLIFLLPIIFTPLLLTSQTSVHLQVGKAYKTNVSSNSNHRIVDPNTHNLIHAKKRRVEVLDAEKLTSKAVFISKEFPKQFSTSGCYTFNGKLFMIYYTVNVKTTTTTYWGVQISFDTGETIGEHKKIIAFKEYLSGRPIIQFSDKTKKGLFVIRRSPKNSNDAKSHDIIETFIFDDNLNVLTASPITMPYTEQKMDNLGYFLGKDDKVYLFAKVRADGGSKNYKKQGKHFILKFHIEFIQFNLKNKSTKITKLDFGDYNFEIFTPSFDDDGTIKLVGYYSESASDFIPPANGIFVANFNIETGELKNKLYQIPLEILDLYESNRERAKNKKEGAGLDALYPIIVKWEDDNSLILVGEQLLERTSSTTNSTGLTTVTTKIIKGDILVAKINPDGELAYINRIPKRGYAGSFSSCYIDKKDAIYYFSIDHHKNLNLKTDDVPEECINEKDLDFIMVKINKETGDFEKKSIFKYGQKKGNYTLAPHRILNVSPISNEGVFIHTLEDTKNFVTNTLLMKALIKEE